MENFFEQIITDLETHNMTEELEELKQSKLKEFRALQDLIYGDLTRSNRTVRDVICCIDIMKTAFEIQSATMGQIEAKNFNTTETGY